MKNLLLAALILATVTSQAQTRFFTLSDSSVEQGAVFRSCTILYDLNGHSNLMEPSYPCLDSVAAFMSKHPEVIWEIASYTDQRGSDSANAKLSQSRASVVKKYLYEHGVPAQNLVAVGYGEKFPLVSQKEIDANTTKAEKESLYQQNRRTEFKALIVSSPGFSLTDSVFTVGAVMRIPVLFDLAKPTLRPESKPLLDSISAFLLAHPELMIEVSNHGDSRTSNAYSNCLSCSRAKTVADYFISKGVPAAQISYKGYKDSVPLVSDAYIRNAPTKSGQEELHALNRRTEIRIVKIQ